MLLSNLIHLVGLGLEYRTKIRIDTALVMKQWMVCRYGQEFLLEFPNVILFFFFFAMQFRENIENRIIGP